MTRNKSYLTDYQDINGGFIAFARSPKGGKITGKGKIRTGELDFEDVYFVKELKFNLFSISQMCEKKNSVLFTKTGCLVLSPDFKLLDESQVLLKVPRQNNMYSFDLKNVVPSRGLTCLFAKATIDESNLWHRRLGHINFKTMNKLVRGNLIRGLPSKLFENDHTCVACQKGKQHKDSCIETNVNARQAGQEKASDHEYILLRLILSNSPLSSSTQSTDDKDVDEVLDKGDDDKDKDNAQEIPDEFYGELTFFLGLQTASTPMEPNKALVKDEEADNVDVHLYKSMIRSLMYLTASRPDITFAVCACAWFQITPKVSHLYAVKRIFRYLKALTGNPQQDVVNFLEKGVVDPKSNA
ncbi:ribonuclease H-like domain-containing protein [Tanacetum coccineum]